MYIAWSSIIIVLIVFLFLWWHETKKYEINLDEMVAKEEVKQEKQRLKIKHKKSIFSRGLFWFGIAGLIGIILLILD